MFEAIRLRDHKGLRVCELTDLSRINVVCGKNNSGKSTVLEAIASPQNSIPGRRLSPEDVESLFTATVGQMGWRNTNRDLYENRQYLQLLRGIADDTRTWFLEDDQAFNELLKQEFQRSHLNRWAYPDTQVQNAFKALFVRPSTVLLPPKRTLEVAKGIAPSESLTPSGIGLLNYLFYCKNRPKGSPDRDAFDQVSSQFEILSSGFGFDVFVEKDNTISLRFSDGVTGSWVGANDCGLGLQDLLVILSVAVTSDRQVILIEEPESHMHPEMQRRLLSYLRSVNKQFFLSSHSNIFTNTALVDKVFLASFDGEVHVSESTSKAVILNDLGYSVADNLVSDIVILTEGPTDIPVLEEFLLKMGVFGKYNVRLWPLGGDIMGQVDLTVLADKSQLVALVDRDPGSNRVRERFIRNCRACGIPVHRLRAYSIENYFSIRALREVFHGQVGAGVDRLSPDAKVEDQIGLSPKKRNRDVARAMNIEELNGTDLLSFLEKIRRLCVTQVEVGRVRTA